MSETDIYNNKEQRDRVKPGEAGSGKRRRRRSSESSGDHTFDEQKTRRRRSSNKGLRRVGHKWKKGPHQKRFLWFLLIATVLILVALALWQYWAASDYYYYKTPAAEAGTEQSE